MAVDEEQDRATGSTATRIDDDDGVGAGKAVMDMSNGPDENAQSLADDNHGVPV